MKQQRKFSKWNPGKIFGFLIPFFILVLVIFISHVSLFSVFKNFLRPTILNIIAAVILVQFFSGTIKEAGFDDYLMQSIKMFTKKKYISLILPPMLFGLLPMPAGALVSAGFTEKGGESMQMSKDKIFFVNYWMRHIWEYSWPLYAGVILGAGFLNMSTGKFALIQFPLVIMAFLLGIIPVFIWIRNHKNKHFESREKFKLSIFTLVFLPIVILFVLILGFRVNINIALIISIITVFVLGKVKIKKTGRLLIKSLFSFTTLLIITVLLMKTALESGSLVKQIYDYFISSGFSVTSLGFLIAIVSGFLTGITQASVGITFPVFLKFSSTHPGLFPFLYAVGFMGVMVSPFHLCFLTTKEYFKLDWKDSLKYNILPAIIMVIFAYLYGMLLG